MAGQEMELLLEVTRWDPPRCYGIRMLNFKLVMSLPAVTIRRQHEGDLRKVKELMETRAL